MKNSPVQQQPAKAPTSLLVRFKVWINQCHDLMFGSLLGTSATLALVMVIGPDHWSQNAATLVGAALGASIAVVGAFVLSRNEARQERLQCRAALFRIAEHTYEWTREDLQRVRDETRELPDQDVMNQHANVRQNFLRRDIYTLEKLIDKVRSLDIQTLATALALMADLRAATESTNYEVGCGIQPSYWECLGHAHASAKELIDMIKAKQASE